MTDYKVIDNWLQPKDFETIKNLFLPTALDGYLTLSVEGDGVRTTATTSGHYIPWTYSTTSTGETTLGISGKQNIFFLTAAIYVDEMGILSPFYTYFRPAVALLGVKALKRIRCNLFPNTETVYEHVPHTDTDYSINAAILSINTCDGYTTLEDGTRVDSVANRVLLFDASTLHSSSTTSNEVARMNVNINYF